MCGKCASRREILTGGFAATLAATLGLSPAQARSYVVMETLCTYAGRPSLTRFKEPTQHAVNAVVRIQKAIDYDTPIHVYIGDAGNALASIVSDDRGNRQRVIVYSPTFMEDLQQRGGPAAPLSVLAHEVGHHYNGDLDARGKNRTAWTKELGADYTAGLALSRLGYTPDEATRALRLLFSRFGSKTHPDTPRRLEWMNAGWRDGGRKEGLDLG